MNRPLEQFEILNTRHMDEAREQVARRFCAHRLEMQAEAPRFHARHRVAAGGLFSLNFIHYGARVLIEPGELNRFYLIQIPLHGGAEIANGGTAFVSDPGTAAILNPDRHTRMVWHADCEQLLLYIPVEALRAFAEVELDRPLSAPVVFDPVMDFRRPALSAWRRKVLALVAAADEGRLFGNARAVSQTILEQEVLADLLALQPGNIQPLAASQCAGASPAQCRRAMAFIRSHADCDVRLEDIARAAGVPARTLQHGFKASYGRTPIETLKAERLMRAHCELASGHDEATVTEVAARWGFFHFGRFSRHYRERFGQLPSQTRARALAMRCGRAAP
ncbi:MULTISPECIES: AraC family transcriptional regulator [unclassified Roseitalea]|uniref:AraC family transcriptional regulator n=1 Tax=unclassified Roseitalea TaxID=2639107 RepID=UPI00273ED923|nr:MULTISPECIES: AraC family transcriptional regulator [unclassified Roseitalea]